ncbi:hypothetical protein V6N13_102109 [Hibiscus sabdariffa]|uniref:Transcription initiation factor TFIID subunit 15 n=1 Tax=Hibiscus sabdariffa TaxID=183260 RepID=A0ABR2D3U6_9ROSI
MASNSGKGALTNGSVYICNLPEGTDETMLAEYFGTIGLLKKDKRTGRPKIWLYRDKVTNEPKGDATVTYEDPHAALAAVEWFNKDFHGSIIGVFIAESKSSNAAVDPSTVVGNGGGLEEDAATDMNGGGGRGRGRGDASGKTWQQEGDWLCPNTSCSNVNFAFRGVCNRCGTAQPAGASGSGGGAGGRGRGRAAPDSGSHGRAGGATGALFGPNDWPCPIGGRGGGYKELDEEEIEERRQCRPLPGLNLMDDGEMYDEFGNLKKKFRAKTQQAEAGRPLPGSGRAGWEVEELGVVDRDGRERSRDRGRGRDDRESSKSRDREDRERHRSRSRERDRRKDHSRDYDYDYDRDRDYGWDREIEIEIETEVGISTEKRKIQYLVASCSLWARR